MLVRFAVDDCEAGAVVESRRLFLVFTAAGSALLAIMLEDFTML
jgi:hypothetical protein